MILLFVLGVIVALSRLGAPPARLTEEEYQRRIDEGGSFLSAGVMGLQKILEPGVERAAVVLQDYKSGHYNGEQKSGDGDEAGAGAKAIENNSSETKEKDA